MGRQHKRLDELKTDYLPRPNPGLVVQDGPNRRVCCAGPHFALERWTLTGPPTEPPHPERCLTLSNVGDPVRIEYGGGTECSSGPSLAYCLRP